MESWRLRAIVCGLIGWACGSDLIVGHVGWGSLRIATHEPVRQVFGDLSPTHSTSQYRTMTQSLLAAGHTIFPALRDLSPTSLASIDVLYLGARKDNLARLLTLDDSESLIRFVGRGGQIIVEADSQPDDATNVNLLLDALGLPGITQDGEIWLGPTGIAAGRFTDQITSMTQGPAGDLRTQTFSSTASSFMPDPGLASMEHQVLGKLGAFNTLVQIDVLPGNPRGGSLLFVGDPIFTDEYTSPTGSRYNANNLSALENYVSWLNELAGGVTSHPCDLSGDDQLTVEDIDLLAAALREGSASLGWDLNGDRIVDDLDLDTMIESPLCFGTYYGDANLDREFNSSDFVAVFTLGEYEDAVAANSTWSDGDWTGDGEFTTSDFVKAFQAGGYETGPRPATFSVPEPASASLLGWGLLLLGHRGVFQGLRTRHQSR